MTTPNEYEEFIQEQSNWYSIAPDEIKYIIERGRQLYYQSLADWAENNLDLSMD